MNNTSDCNHNNSPIEEKTDVRVSELVGDRTCLKCGYNLIGQPIVRERHYDLLMVRCPECATVAALQEYPMLGRWANRWAMLLAGMWFLVLCGMVLATGLTLSSLSSSIASAACQKYMNWLGDHQYAWMKENDDPDFATIYVDQGDYYEEYPWVYFDSDWWAAQDADELLRQAGGWGGITDWTALRGWSATAICSIVFGIFWATVLMKFGRIRLFCYSLLLVLVAGGLSMFVIIPFGYSLWFYTQTPSIYEVATDAIYTPLLVISLAFTLIPLSIGMLMGRPMMRMLIRLLLSPRQCSALSLLWTCDGKELPGLLRR